MSVIGRGSGPLQVDSARKNSPSFRISSIHFLDRENLSAFADFRVGTDQSSKKVRKRDSQSIWSFRYDCWFSSPPGCD